ncbi:MAG: efflux RND transporter permease subunit, partial [Leadbetterella sp.]
IQSPSIKTLATFKEWYQLSQDVKKIPGVKNVLSLGNISTLHKNEELKTFEIEPLCAKKPSRQDEVDSLFAKLATLPFYEGLLYNKDAHLMAITFDQNSLNSKSRIDISEQIQKAGENFQRKTTIVTHFSGMPFIRTNFMKMVQSELGLFMSLAIAITTLILFLFFRSLANVAYAMFVVIIGVVWCLGIMTVFGYSISILTGLIPPLIIIIGRPNTIFFINKYQEEFLRTGDKMQALEIMLEKIGKTTFLANVTTFIGFFVFYFTNSPLLSEFGVVASISVLGTWAVSMVLIPTIFSLVGTPNAKHVRHLENKNITKILLWVDKIVHTRRTKTYWFVGVLVIVAAFGVTRIKALGYLVDDLPENDPIYTHLQFIEKNFNGIVPIEVKVDTRTPNGIFDAKILNKIRLVQKEFAKYPEFTKPLSIVEGIKFLYQSYRGGDPKYYVLPPALELQKLSDYLGKNKNKDNMLSSFLNADKSMTRISFQSEDVGTVRYEELYDKIQPKIDSIFNYDSETAQFKAKNERVDVQLTGNGIVFTKGNNYLLGNLQESSLLALLLVCLVMTTLFLNVRTILISTIPSIIPLIITAGIMGFFNIPLKPSTILIFSISFGIASDGTIYFLTKYKDELLKGKSISEAISETIKFTGLSMFYTAFILFFGFGIFVGSSFKGTFFLGLLISITLLIGMISNLILLPCFLMTLDKKEKERIVRKSK